MAVVNRTVDEILKLDAHAQAAPTLWDYLCLVTRSSKMKDAFMAELAEFYSLAPPSGTPLLS
jgi:hypothetical protein